MLFELSLLIQYELLLFFFNFKISFLNNFNTTPVGVTTPKKIIAITIGDIIFPNNKPNLIQALFSGVKIFELIIPKNKNIKDIKIDQSLIFSSFKIGHKLIIKKTKKNKIQKLRFEEIDWDFIFI